MQYFCSKHTNTNQTKSSNVVDDRPLILRIFKCFMPKTNKMCDALYAQKILKYNPEKTTSKERIWARNTIEQYKEYNHIEDCKLYGKVYTPLPKNSEIHYTSNEIMLMMKEDVKLLDKLKLNYIDYDTNLKGCYTNLKSEGLEHYSKKELEECYQRGKERREQEQRQQEKRKQERSHYQRQQKEFLQSQEERKQEQRAQEQRNLEQQKRKEEHIQKILMEQEQYQTLFVMKSLKKHTLTKEQINQIEELEKDYKQRQLEKMKK